MIVIRGRGLLSMVSLLILLTSFTGCARQVETTEDRPQGMHGHAVQQFEQQVEGLVAQIIATQYGTKGEFAPVAVVPGAIKSGVPYTHLEEVIADALLDQLQTTNELYVFTSQNWFEYREGRPLSFWKNPAGDRQFLQQMKIFEVRVAVEPVFAKAEVEIVVSDARGRRLHGQRAEITLGFSADSPAVQLNAMQAIHTPFPEGIEERPFTSVDRFAFSLVADLIDTYQAGVLGAGRRASDEDVQVVLSVTPTTLVAQRTIDSIVKSLQHAIVRAKGVTCVLSSQDNMEAEQDVEQGTVLLVIDFDRAVKNDVITVALRGVWQVSPLETVSGTPVDGNLAGTYLAGFTAKSYLQIAPRTSGFSASGGSVGLAETLASGSVKADLMVCFHRADDVLLDKSYQALRHIPGVQGLQWGSCSWDRCGCWTMTYDKSASLLAGWLRKNLTRYTDWQTFTVRPQGPDKIEVMYQGSHGRQSAVGRRPR